MKSLIIICTFLFLPIFLFAQSNTIILKADRVFDGTLIHDNWTVTVKDNYIIAVGPSTDFKDVSKSLVLDLGDVTLMPGMIEGHSHLLLHPYNEVGWNDQVLKDYFQFIS